MTNAATEPEPSPAALGDASGLSAQLARLEHRLDPQGRFTGPDGGVLVPAWRRVTEGENRWPVALATAVAIGLQVALPDRLNLASRFLLPALEAVMLVLLVSLNPRRVDRVSRPLRRLALALIAVGSLANAYSATLLVIGLVNGSLGGSAGLLLSTGAAIYLTNVIIFALWYWELDRGARPREPPRPISTRTFSSRRWPLRTLRTRTGSLPSLITCTSRSPMPPSSARPTRCP